MIITAGRILHPYLIYITHGLLSSSSFTRLNILYKIFPLTFTSCTFRVVTVSLLAIRDIHVKTKWRHDLLKVV